MKISIIMLLKAGVVISVGVAMSAGIARAVEISKYPIDSPTLNAIMVKGPIERDDELKFLDYLNKLPRKNRIAVYLNSEGGDLSTGLELGKLFYDHRIKTVVEGDNGLCASACALAFLGGVDENGHPWRAKSSTSRLGFHSFAVSYKEGTYSAADMASAVESSQAIAFDILEYMQYIGVDPKFLRLMFKARSYDMNWISNADALRLGIKVWDERGATMIDPETDLARPH